MKNPAFFFLLIFSTFVYGQSDTIKAVNAKPVEVTPTPKEVQPPNEFKVNAKNFTTELNVNLFQGSLTLNNALQQIKVRYFVNNGWAYRFALNFNSQTASNGQSAPYGTNPNNYNDDRKSTTIGLGFGFEKHFVGTNRLSPYIGAELSLVNRTTSETTTNNTITTSIDGAWVNYTQTYVPNFGYYTTSAYDQWAFFRYGLNLVGGFDYYVAKHFYLGYEFTIQYYNTSYKDINVTVTGQTQGNNNTNPTSKKSETFLGPNVVNGIRVGFVF